MSPEDQAPTPGYEGRRGPGPWGDVDITREDIRAYHSHLVLNFAVKRGAETIDQGRVKLSDKTDRERVARQVVETMAPYANGRCPNAEEVLQRFFGLRDEAEDGGPGGSAAFGAREQLINFALKHAELFHDAAKTCYARVAVDDRIDTYPTESGDFKLWLENLYYQQTGKGLGAQTITDAISQINAVARFDAPEREVWRRVAPDDLGGCYIDLCDGHGNAVHVTRLGWTPVQNPPVEFIRGPGAKALPMPERGGTLDTLKGYLNIRDERSWSMVKAYLVAGLYPAGPYTVLQFRAEHGAAKTTAGRVIRSLIDPAKAPMRREPKTSDDLAVAAIHNWLVCFDNLSHIQQWLSDDLCRLCTGGGFEARQYYTRADQFLAEATRPVLITSITECVTSEDLVDRLLPVILPHIPKSKRRSEKKFWEAFEKDRAKIFGALLDRLSGALRVLPQIPEENLPRMADFTKLTLAAEVAAGEKPTFLAAYESVREEADRASLDNNVLGPTLRKVWARMSGEKQPPIKNPVDGTMKSWEGTMAALLDLLNGEASEATKRSSSWPKSARGLSAILHRLNPALRRHGVLVEFSEDRGADGRQGANRDRMLKMTLKDPEELEKEETAQDDPNRASETADEVAASADTKEAPADAKEDDSSGEIVRTSSAAEDPTLSEDDSTFEREMNAMMTQIDECGRKDGADDVAADR